MTEGGGREGGKRERMGRKEESSVTMPTKVHHISVTSFPCTKNHSI